MFALAKVVRAKNLAITGWLLLMAQGFIFNIEHTDILFFGMVSLSILLAAASGYIINDYYDVKIDVINKPKEVIIGRSISKKHALLYYFIFNGLSLALSVLGGWKVVITVSISLILLWFYSNSLKRLPFIGNLAVSALAGLTLFVLAVFNETYSIEVFLFITFAFGSTLVREILKDLEDRKGDAEHGCKTLPIVLGVPLTKSILSFIIASYTVGSGILAYLINTNMFIFLSSTVGPLYAYTFYLLIRADSKKHFARLSRISKLIMLIGIFAMIF